MSALKKGLKVSPPGSFAGSFCLRKKKSSPCGPYFPGTFHLHGRLGVNTHHPSDPRWATSPPRSASPTTLEGSQRPPLENAPSTMLLEPRTSSMNFQHNFRALSSATIESLRGNFSVAPAEILDSKHVSVSFRTPVECTPSRRCQGMMLVHPNRLVSSVLSTLGQCFVSSQPVLCRHIHRQEQSLFLVN